MDEKKQVILEKARELFFIYGVKKTTVDEIAKSAGIGKGTVYLHFSSKEDIISSLAMQEANTIAAQLDKVITKEQNIEKKLRVFIKSFIMNSYDFVNSNVHAADIFNAVQKYTNTCKIGEQSYEIEWSETTEILSKIFLEGEKNSIFIFDDLFETMGNISFALRGYFPPLSTNISRDYLDKKSDYIIDIIIGDLKK